MQDQRPDLQWRDGYIPVSARFGDPYFSLDDGLAETRHVFLDGNGLPARFARGFHIAELGFGTGLNMLAAWAAWEQSGFDEPLDFTSFEAFPMDPEQMARALQAFPGLAPWSNRFLSSWTGQRKCDLGSLRLELVMGDARETLPDWVGRADAWFLDGFAPARNPELWGADLMRQVALHTAPGGTVATYTAAGEVRRGLTQAGFDVTRCTGYGRKRHMTRGVLA
ncbi:tRNA (5-methylaminomethyl-2-thiouridine)(34)-methyltransferase MnmD [Sedimentitalea sp. JM2-8]|uniref:tRNA (5-methylaminomethyl-2-thiouridine)(34)-methyltransferase MnmD n=1 Tax=Sedimentitalea xiamensis TaxID=3050037 RepID=A0ABT7FFZ0_9RHOB|nr:tRNA (5-methylaminomethyl-2-thiouridine)(34)-methyltransferase MnmD [Sedimentitalea xiamensis]MDK3074049.1 tRNA (5-methylaminomethyl-2-thiouridine)(34)-methyltransferase MnmD [Sedimentitalea xiamensis]